MGVQFSNKNLELLQSYSKILKNHSEIAISHTLYEAMKRDEESEATNAKPKMSMSVLSTERSPRRTKDKKRKDSDKSKSKPHSGSPSSKKKESSLRVSR